MTFYQIQIYLNFNGNKKYKPGSEHIKFIRPYIIETLILADADNAINKETSNAVNSLTPQPPILIGKVIENRIIGEKTMNAKQSISKPSETADIIYMSI